MPHDLCFDFCSTGAVSSAWMRKARALGKQLQRYSIVYTYKHICRLPQGLLCSFMADPPISLLCRNPPLFLLSFSLRTFSRCGTWLPLRSDTCALPSRRDNCRILDQKCARSPSFLQSTKAEDRSTCKPTQLKPKALDSSLVLSHRQCLFQITL